jgi:hypothetical protein
MKRIPAIWRIDIEPDEHTPGLDHPAWNGFVAMAGLVEQLRRPLADCSGTALHPTWFFRLDPDIERCFGRADFVVDRYRSLVDQIRAHDDPLGIHVHYYRWDEQKRVTYSDYADPGWITHCINGAARVFEHCFGEPVRRSSQGGYFLSEVVVDQAIAVGVKVDVSAEPGLAALNGDISMGAYATAPSPDFKRFPRRPYYPSRRAVGTPARSAGDARPLLIVPLSAYDCKAADFSWLRRTAKRILRRPQYHLPLNPWKTWPDPRTYWDFVARAADEGPARYAAFAIRTDSPDSDSYRRVSRLLEYLPQHPIAQRLCFVDPLSPEIRDLANVQTKGWKSKAGDISHVVG